MDVTKKTVLCTTQYLLNAEAETREYMRDYFKSRIAQLRPDRTNDVCLSDTSFSSVKSVRGYSCFQTFAFRYVKYDVPHIIGKESQASEKFSDLVRSAGDPRGMVNNNACAMTGKHWFKALRTNCIDDHASEAYH